MFVVYVNLHNVRIAKLAKGFLNRKKQLILASSSETLNGEKAVIILPADITYIFKETITPLDNKPRKGRASREQLRGFFKIHLKELKIEEDKAICFSTKIDAKGNTGRHLLIIIHKAKLAQLLQKAKQTDLKIEGFLLEPIVLHKLLSNEIAGDEKRLILNIGKEESLIYLLDRFGPVTLLSKTISTSKIIPATQKLLKESPDIEKACNLGLYFGEKSLAFDKRVFEEQTGIKLISADKVLSARLNKAEIILRTSDLLNKFILVASAAILFNKKEIIELDGIDLSFEEQKSIIAKPAVQPLIVKEKRFSSIRLILISLGVAFIAAGLVLGALRLRMGGLLSGHGETPTTVPTQTQVAPTPTLTPTPTINPKDVKLRVLNGGGVRGAATKISAFLKDKNFEVASTGNAPSFDFEKTEVRYKKDAKNKANLIIESLDGKLSVATAQASLFSDDEVDVEIIVGRE